MSDYSYSKLSKKDILSLDSRIIDSLIEGANVYQVLNNKKRPIAVFEIIKVAFYNKTIRIDISPQNIKEVISLQDVDKVVDIHRFIFISILKITEKQRLEKFKIYSQNNTNRTHFYRF